MYAEHGEIIINLVRVCVCVCLQGARVWVREKEQLVPATVNSCGDGTLVLTTDYGEVRDWAENP